mmetsp:Transcript_52388/g.138896  ORF Transcript_52388/g.138896 Transcript_52388/m.138896 type:complete len:245 (-) Transcript_52388:930-1664(-)
MNTQRSPFCLAYFRASYISDLWPAEGRGPLNPGDNQNSLDSNARRTQRISHTQHRCSHHKPGWSPRNLGATAALPGFPRARPAREPFSHPPRLVPTAPPDCPLGCWRCAADVSTHAHSVVFHQSLPATPGRPLVRGIPSRSPRLSSAVSQEQAPPQAATTGRSGLQQSSTSTDHGLRQASVALAHDAGPCLRHPGQSGSQHPAPGFLPGLGPTPAIAPAGRRNPPHAAAEQQGSPRLRRTPLLR